MIAEHALRAARVDERTHLAQHGGAVRTAIDQVTDEDERPAFGMTAILRVAEMV